jgi:hypothetical protein
MPATSAVTFTAPRSTGFGKMRSASANARCALMKIQYGLIAEEVAEVMPDLVARSADGQIETVKYPLLDPLLLNELQKQAATIRALEERLARLEAALSAGRR